MLLFLWYRGTYTTPPSLPSFSLRSPSVPPCAPLHSFLPSLFLPCARGKAAASVFAVSRSPAAENAPGPTCADFSKVQSTIAVCRLCSDSFTTAVGRERLGSKGGREKERIHFSPRTKIKKMLYASKYLSSLPYSV